MSRFYGIMGGSGSGVSTRCGHATTGLHTSCASHEGCVYCRAYVNNDDVDCVRVELGRWQGSGPDPAILLYNGPLAGPPPQVAVEKHVDDADVYLLSKAAKDPAVTADTRACPECGSALICYDGEQLGCDEASQIARCEECDHKWADVYLFSHSERLK